MIKNIFSQSSTPTIQNNLQQSSINTGDQSTKTKNQSQRGSIISNYKSIKSNDDYIEETDSDSSQSSQGIRVRKMTKKNVNKQYLVASKFGSKPQKIQTKAFNYQIKEKDANFEDDEEIDVKSAYKQQSQSQNSNPLLLNRQKSKSMAPKNSKLFASQQQQNQDSLPQYAMTPLNQRNNQLSNYPSQNHINTNHTLNYNGNNESSQQFNNHLGNSQTQFNFSPNKIDTQPFDTQTDFNSSDRALEVDKVPQNIFQQRDLLDGYHYVGDHNNLLDNGQINSRTIVGDTKWFVKYHKTVQGKEKGLGSRMKVSKKQSIQNAKSQSKLGSSSISIINSDDSQQQKNKKNQYDRYFCRDLKTKNDLKYELMGVKQRLKKNQENQKDHLDNIDHISMLQNTKQERILKKYEEMQKNWVNMEQEASQKIQRNFKSTSIYDLEKYRVKNEIRQLQDERAKELSFVGNARAWELNLRENKISNHSRMQSLDSSRQIIQEEIDEDTTHHNHIQQEKNERRRSYRIMGDLPEGFQVPPSKHSNIAQEVVRNPFYLRKQIENFNLTGFSSFSTKNSVQMNQTYKSMIESHQSKKSRKTMSQQLPYLPQCEDLFIQGQNQLEREINMVGQSQQNFFKYKNPKLIAKEHAEQLILMSKDEEKIENYDLKVKASKIQYMDKIKKQQPRMTKVQKMTNKIRVFTKLFNGFKNSNEDDYNLNIQENEKTNDILSLAK